MFLTAAFLLVVAPFDVMSEDIEHTMSETILPYNQNAREFDNSDLVTLIDEAERIASAAKQCGSYDCPVVSCDQASLHIEYLNQMRFALRNQYYWTRKAAKSYYSDLVSHIRENSDDTDLVRRAEGYVFLQRALVDTGKVILSVTNIASQVTDWDENPVKLGKLKAEEVADVFDGLYETAKDFQSIEKRYRENAGVSEETSPIVNLPDGFGLTGDDLDTLKSHMSDVKTITDELSKLYDSGKSLRDALTDPGGTNAPVALGQIIGRFLAGIAEKKIAAAEKSIRELEELIQRRQGEQAYLFDYYEPYAARRDMAEDAYHAYENLIVISKESGDYISGEYTFCLLKTCPRMSRDYDADPGAPREFIGNPRQDMDYGGNWAKAIPFWHARITELHDTRPELPDIANPPPMLALSSENVETKEIFTVNVVAPACQDASYLVRMLDDIGHQVSQSPVRESTSALRWGAPNAVGTYQMLLLRNEILVDTAAILVSDPNVLVGLWSFEYQDTKRGAVTGRLAVHPGGKVNGEFDGGDIFRNGQLRSAGNRITGRPIDVPVDLLLNKNGDRLTGTWSDAQTTGGSFGSSRAGANVVWKDDSHYWFTASDEEEWTRATPSITSVRLWKPVQGADYDSLIDTCDSAAVQGNYPEFGLDLVGKGFPTWEWNWDLEDILSISFPDEPNIIVNSISVSDKSGEEVIRVFGWLRCYPHSSSPLVIQPGRKTVLVNDISYDWDLDFANYSGPPPISQMAFVETESSGFRAITAPIAIGEIVHVEVEFESPPSENTIDVFVRISGSPLTGNSISVIRVDDSDSTYRSAAIRIVP